MYWTDITKNKHEAFVIDEAGTALLDGVSFWQDVLGFLKENRLR